MEPIKSEIHNNISINYLNQLEKHIDQNNFDYHRKYPNTNKIAIIVEPRPHPLLKSIIKCIN